MDPSILRLIRRAQDAPDPASLPALPRPDRLLMAEPTFVDAVDRPAGEAPIDRFANPIDFGGQERERVRLIDIHRPAKHHHPGRLREIRSAWPPSEEFQVLQRQFGLGQGRLDRAQSFVRHML